ncbi:hypothetical protein AMK19_32645 [Kitasatospora sp. CB01950]|nr:hypothetical protein AMK19_32645 [Kitasatospora sp. CB01950]
MDTDLLDVRAAVEGTGQQEALRSVGGVRADPEVAELLVRREVRGGGRRVVGDLRHADGAEGCAGGELEPGQQGQVGGRGGAER